MRFDLAFWKATSGKVTAEKFDYDNMKKNEGLGYIWYTFVIFFYFYCLFAFFWTYQPWNCLPGGPEGFYFLFQLRGAVCWNTWRWRMHPWWIALTTHSARSWTWIRSWIRSSGCPQRGTGSFTFVPCSRCRGSLGSGSTAGGFWQGMFQQHHSDFGVSKALQGF